MSLQSLNLDPSIIRGAAGIGDIGFACQARRSFLALAFRDVTCALAFGDVTFGAAA
jgi:hypothetical protein